MKRCTKCKIEKELSEFSKNRSRRDRLQHVCKECCREYQQTATGKEVSQKAHRKYRETKAGKEIEWKYAQSDPGKEVRRKTNQKYKRLNTKKTKPHHAVEYALKTGKLTRPNHCESCFKECRPDGHHEDYSRPLDVEWLCKKCHTNLHRRVSLCQLQT